VSSAGSFNVLARLKVPIGKKYLTCEKHLVSIISKNQFASVIMMMKGSGQLEKKVNKGSPFFILLYRK
jgi:hypothetical protein